MFDEPNEIYWWELWCKDFWLQHFKEYKTRVGTIKSFKKFAKLNGIGNYSIK